MKYIKKGELFPLGGYTFPPNGKMVEYIGEYRQPKAGEWFLSGAIVEGYQTKHDLKDKYHIGKLVKVKHTQITIIEKEDWES